MHADRLEEEMNAQARGDRAVSVRSYDSRSSHARAGETQNTDRHSHSTSSRHHRSHRDDDDDADDRDSSYSSRRRRTEQAGPDSSPPRRERVRERARRSIPHDDDDGDDDEQEYRHRRRASYDRTDRDRPRDPYPYERERERESDRRRDSDHYYPRDSKRRRSRSRDAYERPRRHRDDYDERERERDIPQRRYPDDRRMRDERRQRSPPRRRHSPSYDDESRSNRRQRSPSPELDEEQREMRSIFVSQLSARVGDRELGIFFEHQAGKVREARVIVDRISRRSKGVGYVEFVELETVQKALTLSGTKLLGIPIAVQYTEAEKNRQAREPGAVAAGNAPPGGAAATQGQAPPNQFSLLNRLYVGSLNFALTDEDVRQVFQSFGEITRVDLHRDAITNKSKGYAFVQFKEVAHAQEALEKMNNFVLAGREIKVGLVGDRTMSANRGETQLQQEDGPSLNNISRIELMQKLARSDQPEEMDALKTSVPRPIIPTATTRNVVMANAFNPEEETEPDWDVELRDDVKEECQNSYGPILDIYVLKESKGEIYIRFGAVEDAIKAVAGLNGRFFGGNQITASHTSDQLFDAKK